MIDEINILDSKDLKRFKEQFKITKETLKEQIPEILGEIYLSSERFVYLGISTKNGVEPIGWWKTMIEKYAPRKVYTHIKTYGNCNSYEILWEDQYLEWYINNI